MRPIRIYQAIPLQAGQAVELDTQSALHVTKVLRLSVGDPVVLFNGDGAEYSGNIDQLSKRSTVVALGSRVENNVESCLQIHLGQCLSRGDRMDYAIQKSVELGVAAIYPLNSQRSGVHIAAERQQKKCVHWQRIVISACEQCGRNNIPTVHSISHLETWINTVGADKKYLLDPNAGLSIKQLGLPVGSHVAVLIGPEGGLSVDEINLATQSGFIALRLGPRVLRTETAAAATITAMQAVWGDLA